MQPEAVEAVNSEGFGLRLEFRWLGDRYGQVISKIEPNRASESLLESLEGAPNDVWPTSPPLQTLSLEKLPDGRSVALLVGMAGRSHWSASIEPAADRAELTFDIACRHPNLPHSLGSNYRRLGLAPHWLSIASADAKIGEASGVTQIAPLNVDDRTTRWRYTVAINSAQY